MALIYVDMDNVIVDFKSALRKRGLPEDQKNADDIEAYLAKWIQCLELSNVTTN